MRDIALTTYVVRDYDESIRYFVDILGFALIDDSPSESTLEPGAEKRWVVVAPDAESPHRLLLAKASDAEQESRIGNQTGGRVAFFLFTDDFDRDYARYQERGVEFPREAPRKEAYGTVVVFRDLYGNLWDLIEPADKTK